MGTMKPESDYLTREQVELLCPLANFARQTVKTKGGHIGVYSALALMIDHDVVQRAELERLNEKVKALEEGTLHEQMAVPFKQA